MRATRFQIAPASSARARSLTRELDQGRGGLNASSREPFLLVCLEGDVTSPISKVSVTRQKSAAEAHDEGAVRHVSEPVGRALATPS